MNRPEDELQPGVLELLDAAREHAGRGQRERAEQLARQALHIAPGSEQAMQYLAALALDQGHYLDAEKLLLGVLRRAPDDPETYGLLGRSAYERKDFETAVAYYHEAAQLQPEVSMRHESLALALYAARQNEQAATAYRQALAVDPYNTNAWYNLGVLEQQQGRYQEAVEAYWEALRLSEDDERSWRNLGYVLTLQDREEEALSVYERAVASVPHSAPLWEQLGNGYKRSYRWQDARRAYERAYELDPKQHAPCISLGNVCWSAGEADAACRWYEKAVRLKPDSTEALHNLAFVNKHDKRLVESLRWYRELARYKPDDCFAQFELVGIPQELCDWRDYDARMTQLVQQTRSCLSEGRLPSVPAHMALAMPFEPRELQSITRAFVRHHIRAPARVQVGDASPTTAMPEKLRIGYVSPNFRDHATAHLMVRMFELHDSDRFEIYGYSIGPDDRSEYRQRIARACHRFVDLRGWASEDAARRIAADGIHILVDRAGYTYNSRPEIFAHRPAPIQVNYIGFPGTLGASYVDYIVADRTVIPEGAESDFDEQPVYMPETYLVTDNTQQAAERPPARAECGLPEQGVVFCSFNNHYKIEPGIFDVWMNILRRTPGSVLWLLEAPTDTVANLRHEAGQRGIDPQRLVFAQRVPKAVHLARLSLADLFLDTYYCNAHTTAVDALWSGVPLITCPGASFAGRVAASLLRAARLPELIVGSLSEYEERAVELATRPAELQRLRQHLSQRERLPLFDTAGYTAALEKAFRAMWSQHVAGHPPRPIAIPRVQ